MVSSATECKEEDARLTSGVEDRVANSRKWGIGEKKKKNSSRTGTKRGNSEQKMKQKQQKKRGAGRPGAQTRPCHTRIITVYEVT